MLTYGSLFSGIGGFDLGFDRAGMQCVFQVEKDEYARRVLAKHWPDVRRWDDVCTFPPEPASDWRCDVLCGGFPCQDVSVAGKRVGIDGERSGLWREFYRIICVLRPRIVVVENVPGLLHRGFGRVLGDLSRIGFDAEWSTISACSMGAPFVRKRVFVVAFPASERQRQLWRLECPLEGKEKRDVHWKATESAIPRVVNGVPNRLERLICGGNAVVPQIAEWIGKRIMEVSRK